MSRQSEIAKAFWFLGIVWVVPAMAFAGYMLGREYNKELMGALVGTLLGAFLLFFDILYMSGVIRGQTSKVASRKRTRTDGNSVQPG